MQTATVVPQSLPIQLTHEQESIVQSILSRVRTRDPECIMGKAGVGKTVLLKHLAGQLNSVCTGDGEVVLLSPTGIAAANIGIGAQTIQSFAFSSLGNGSVLSVVNECSKKPELVQRWIRVKILLIDEVSMVSGMLIEKISRLAQRIRGDNRPFGGVKVIFFGDFFQLPPVHVAKLGWAFNSQHWIEMFHGNKNTGKFYVMDTVHRQQGKDADVFIKHLHNIREGKCPQETVEFFTACARSLDTSNGILPTVLFCTNDDVDRVNIRELHKLPTSPVTFPASDDGPLRDPELNSKKLDDATLMPRNLVLKLGAQVVLLRNLDVAGGLVNGSRGVVIEINRMNIPVVLFENGQIVAIEPWRIEIKGRRDTDPVYTRIQIPLKLAWAMTVHKCQGMSLDKAQVNLTRAFESGQAYVALSRVRSASGLQIINGFNCTMIRVHQDVIRYHAVVARKIAAVATVATDEIVNKGTKRAAETAFSGDSDANQ